MDHLDALRATVGAAQVLTGADALPWETDWRERYRGRSLAVVRPGLGRRGRGGRAPVRAGRAARDSPGGQHGVVRRGDARRFGPGGDPVAAAPEPDPRHRHRQRHDGGRGRLRPAVRAAGRARGRPSVSPQPGGRRQLHHRRQPGHQCGRHPGAALRQYARAGPGAGSRHRPGRNLARPARPAQGQHRLRSARPVHRQRGHAGRDHGGDPEAASAAGGALHRAAGPGFDRIGHRHAGPRPRGPGRLADRLRADGGRLPPGRGALLPAAAPALRGAVGRHALVRAAGTVGQRVRGPCPRAFRGRGGRGHRGRASSWTR